MSGQVQTIPMNEDTRSLIGGFLKKVGRSAIRFVNGSGGELADRTFFLVSDLWFGIILGGPVPDGETGTLRVEEGDLYAVGTDKLKAAEDTFATLGAPVFWDDATGEFSDTSTAGYFQVGYLTKVKDADGIEFEKTRYAASV